MLIATKSDTRRVVCMRRGLAVLIGAALMVLLTAFSGAASADSATDLLKQKPFAPTDTTLFSPVIYDGPPLVPAAERQFTEQSIRAELQSLLEQRFGASDARVNEALAVFDDNDTKQLVPDPRLRAGLVSLKGTVGAPAIGGILNGSFEAVRFADANELISPDIIAQVVTSTETNKPEILVNSKFQHEDFRQFSSVLAHESLHGDGIGGGQEELIANSIEAVVYGQMVSEDPQLALNGTKLTRRHNTQLMARLNSRDAQGRLRLLTSTGNVYPNGSIPLANFAAAFNLSVNPNTPGNAVLRQMLANVVGSGVTVPDNPDFDDATANLLDLNQNALSDAEVVRLAEILKLNVYKPTVTAFSPTGKIKSRSLIIGATVRDMETNLASANIKLFVDGKPKAFAYNAANDRLSLQLRNLRFGKHTVRVVATDAQDKSTSATWSFKVAR